MTAAAFKATYSDLRFVKSRKVAQVVVELPIEEASRFVEAFGAPDPSKETWVAIARLVETKAGEPARDAGQKKQWRDLPPSQQAAMRCNEYDFRRFLLKHHQPLMPAGDPDEAAASVRELCGVISRKELDTQPTAAARWKQIDDAFWGWQRGLQ